jgi:bifunctional non-homologous end joining protein LigD
MLAVARRGQLPPDPVVEFKWDGIRVLVETLDATTVVRSRRGNDVTATFPELAAVHQSVGPGVLLDGELVALTKDNVPSFGLLQRRLGITDPVRVEQARVAVPVALIAFDLVAFDGDLITELPLTKRREQLESLDVPVVVQVAPAGSDVDGVLDVAVERGLEGCVVKEPASRYEPGVRSPAWQKIRLVRRQEFVVGGWRPGSGALAGRPGSLVLGVHDEEGLHFVGSVGSGLSDRELDEWTARLSVAAREDPPFVDEVPLRDVSWVQPVHVVDVQFREWTRDNRLRQPSYKGLRIDVDPADVRREPDTLG